MNVLLFERTLFSVTAERECINHLHLHSVYKLVVSQEYSILLIKSLEAFMVKSFESRTPEERFASFGRQL